MRFAAIGHVRREEAPTYTVNQLLADIGGAMGLILGLNILDVILFSGLPTNFNFGQSKTYI